MGKFKLAFGIHNHQPVGNFNAVFEYAHRHSYLPFLKLIEKFESIHLSLHQSGILWQWQKEHHPEYFDLVGKLVDRGQVELMTGGFYEPILISVPERDASGQIAKLSDYIDSHFQCQPDGLWLTERIWEPHLPKLLSDAGIRYLPIDDTHFIYAGLSADQLTGPFVTEESGAITTLLPIQKKLRYLIPFGKVEKVFDELKRQAEKNPEGLAVYADDGEKFGVWPGTHELCFEEAWLEEFFEGCLANSDWLELISLGEAANLPPAGRAYLPSASYAEMLHWALPAKAFVAFEQFEKFLKDEEKSEEFGGFVRGGHWRGFLTKYDESNLIHKRMLSISERLNAFEKANPNKSKDIEKIRDRLYAGQCNCSYWHGVFGGLYLPHLRQAVHATLAGADAALWKASKAKGCVITALDYDADGYDEIVCQTESFSAVFKPNCGGTLLDLSLNKHQFVPTDTLTRRKEGYHHQVLQAVTEAPKEKNRASIHDIVIAKEKGLSKHLIEDWYLKRCFIDHVFGSDVDFNKFRSGLWHEDGDFILEPYEYDLDESKGIVRMSRQGNIWRSDRVIPLKIEKSFTFGKASDEIRVDYRLSTVDAEPVDITFGVENN
ncbi:MAG: alpha-amylase/4-alpha-glucanotransferase domain-containing protein, partial [candidate division Zixibacteria bacterium]